MISFNIIIAQLNSSKSSLFVGDSDGSYGLVMATLLLLFGLLVGIFLYVRRYGFTRPAKTGELEILETRPLGGRQFLVVGRYGHEKFLLGVCPGRIDYLRGLDSDLSQSAELPAGQFSQIYDQVEKRAQ
jgi:flagellar biogenesis protein FliO